MAKKKESKTVGLTKQSNTAEPIEIEPIENVYATAINGWGDGVESLVADTVFKASNPQSHRILSATLNMFKSARDHLGDK